MNPKVPEKDSLKLKHYFQGGIALGLLVALVGGIFWLRSDSLPSENESPAEIAEIAEDSGDDLGFEESVPALEETPVPERKNEVVDLAKASEFFAQNLKPLGDCLDLQNIGPQGSPSPLEPQLENLIDVVKSELGEPILRSEDWVTWNLRVGSEERRIRIETDYSDSDQTVRHLLYFKIDAQGQPNLISLPSEQTKDPTETFIASLQKDGDVYEEEKGLRAYFENGQELVVTEKNGKIDDFEFSNGSKTFRCAGILTSAPSCKCDQ